MLRENFFSLTILIAVAAVLAFIRFTTHPSLNRSWDANQTVLATIAIEGDDVYVRNIRNTQYRTAADFTPTYYDRSFKLNELQRACLVKEDLGGLGRAHLMIEFKFPGPSWVVFSPEPRLERGKTFSAIKGLFRQYELVYIVAAETDAIRFRTNVLHHDVYLYELHLTEPNLKKLFVDVAQRETKLSKEPEFYHTLFNSVESNVVRHLKAVANKWVPGPLLFPANGDHLAFDMKLLRPETPLLTLRQRGLISNIARTNQSDTEFSQQIHDPLEGMYED